jgi:hypothetical protein
LHRREPFIRHMDRGNWIAATGMSGIRAELN